MSVEDSWLTIGIEEEFQIVDQEGHLRSHIDTLLEQATPALGEQVKAEMMQSVVEIGTTICKNVEEARGEIARLRGAIAAYLRPAGLRIVSCGTHPFSHWQEQHVTQMDRYKVLEEEMQDVIRNLLIFGLHVHIGIPDSDLRIEIMNEARYFLPHMLALSTSSPFWLARNTGLKSYRHVIWSAFPRTGIPPEFASWDEFENYIELLVKTGSIDNGRKIWWDMRPHAIYPTLEFRVCDAVPRIEETVMIAGLFQAICAKLIKLRRQNLGFRKYMPSLINENKWRAIRHGMDGKLIDFGKQQEVPMRDLAMELLDFVDDVVDELGSRRAVSHVLSVLETGTSADRQLRCYQQTGHFHAVVDELASETVAGIPAEAPAAS
ncbi:MAG TPA: carboxylate-amine ligase [Candidatus Dormibacteraeota bacterium]|nr:carboxylate-amine ligase [Candidatus Dormibacteraeota bacterium]